MGNVCRICQLAENEMIPLIEESSNSIELKVQGKEFEYCFGLEVLEVPGYAEICSQCQQQLHSFYLFKQKAIKSHHELLHKANEVKKEPDIETETLHQSKDIKKIMPEYSENSFLVVNEAIKNEIEKADNDECNNSSIVCIKATNDVNDSRYKGDDKVASEKKTDSKLKSSELKQKSDKRSKLQNARNKVPRFVCEVCGKRFILKERYKAHTNTHIGLPAYSCKICGKGFSEREHIEYHMKNHNNQRDFVCEICSKAFLSKSDLSSHMKCHNDQKRYICDKCGKLFTFSFQLNAHKDTHSEEKQECSICHAKLNTKRTLRDHMKIVHEQFKNPNLFCILCQKQFNRNYRFTAHMAKRHPENKKT